MTEHETRPGAQRPVEGVGYSVGGYAHNPGGVAAGGRGMIAGAQVAAGPAPVDPTDVAPAAREVWELLDHLEGLIGSSVTVTLRRVVGRITSLASDAAWQLRSSNAILTNVVENHQQLAAQLAETQRLLEQARTIACKLEYEDATRSSTIGAALELLGLPIVVDYSLPPDVLEFRTHNGELAARITGITDASFPDGGLEAAGTLAVPDGWLLDDGGLVDVFDVRTCRLCQCTEDHACDGGCSWDIADPTICSRCASNGGRVTAHTFLGEDHVDTCEASIDDMVCAYPRDAVCHRSPEPETVVVRLEEDLVAVVEPEPNVQRELPQLPDRHTVHLYVPADVDPNRCGRTVTSLDLAAQPASLCGAPKHSLVHLPAHRFSKRIGRRGCGADVLGDGHQCGYVEEATCHRQAPPMSPAFSATDVED